MRAALAAIALLAAAPAFAGPAQDMSRSRIEAIARGDVAAVASAYGEGAALHWIGGPLDGDYAGGEKLKAVWTKFSTAQGAQTARIASVSEAANPKGATVTADVVFAGKNAVKVRHVMVWRDGKLADEIWQVNPNGAY